MWSNGKRQWAPRQAPSQQYAPHQVPPTYGQPTYGPPTYGPPTHGPPPPMQQAYAPTPAQSHGRPLVQEPNHKTQKANAIKRTYAEVGKRLLGLLGELADEAAQETPEGPPKAADQAPAAPPAPPATPTPSPSTSTTEATVPMSVVMALLGAKRRRCECKGSDTESNTPSAPPTPERMQKGLDADLSTLPRL